MGDQFLLIRHNLPRCPSCFFYFSFNAVPGSVYSSLGQMLSTFVVSFSASVPACVSQSLFLSKGHCIAHRGCSLHALPLAELPNHRCLTNPWVIREHCVMQTGFCPSKAPCSKPVSGLVSKPFSF